VSKYAPAEDRRMLQTAEDALRSAVAQLAQQIQNRR
jgi:hypothetical protein